MGRDVVQDDARALAPKVRQFRERLEERLSTLDALYVEGASAPWFKRPLQRQVYGVGQR